MGNWYDQEDSKVRIPVFDDHDIFMDHLVEAAKLALPGNRVTFVSTDNNHFLDVVIVQSPEQLKPGQVYFAFIEDVDNLCFGVGPIIGVLTSQFKHLLNKEAC